APIYGNIVNTYGSSYGSALTLGLDMAVALAHKPLNVMIDCGTGTGFVSAVLVKRFAGSNIVSVDAFRSMLEQARVNIVVAGGIPQLVCPDIAQLPFAGASADLVVAQNSLPLLEEFARICAGGGVVLFVDSSARSVSGIAAKAMSQT